MTGDTECQKINRVAGKHIRSKNKSNDRYNLDQNN